jgi:alcohol dehydrogenase
MRAAVFSQHGEVDQISIQTVPDPECGADDVIIRVNAVSLNGFDPMILRGSTSLKTPLPMIPCGDYAGEIVEVGQNVTDWSVGDRVCPHPYVPGEGMTGETRLGAAAQFARMPAANLVRTPDDVTDIQAATIPIAYGTAYRMMRTRGKVSAGEKVLVLGATGGVGVCCIQLAKAAGAEVIATGSADWKLEKLIEIGADRVINTSGSDFVKEIHEQYGKPRMQGAGGVDVVVNYVGGDNWVKGLKCLAPFGRMLTCGATAGYGPATDIRYVWTYELNIIGSNGWTIPEQIEVLKLVNDKSLKPIIHATRPLAGIREAIQEQIDRKIVGKSVLLPNAGPGDTE